MITEDYVSYKVAKLLREKGFDESCYQKYDDEGYLSFNHNGYINEEEPTEDFSALAPTHQMAMKWLREVHKIDIDILSRLSLNADNDHNYSYVIKHQYDKYHYNTYTDGEYQYFEDAVESALKYCLMNLIK